MQRMINETARKRIKQLAYNEANNIIPAQIIKTTQDIIGQTAVARVKPNAYIEKENIDMAADPVIQYMTKEKLQKLVAKTRKSMEAAVKELDFLEAARLRDELLSLQELLESK
jgi:excinuclease ABC subunit B